MATGNNVFNGLTPEESKRLRTQQMLGLAASLLQASAPSTDPRSGSLAYAFGQGLQGLTSGRQQGLSNILAMRKAEEEQAELKRQESLRAALGQVPTTMEGPRTPVETAIPMNAELAGQLGVTEMPTPEMSIPNVQPRGLTDMLGDYARVYAEQGYPMEAAKLAKVAQGDLVGTSDLPKFHVGFEATWPRPEGTSPNYWLNRRGTSEYQDNLQRFLA